MLTYIFSAFGYEKEEFKNYIQKIDDMTSETITLGEILFGEEFTTAVDLEVKVQVEAQVKVQVEAQVKAQVKAQAEIERIKAEKQKIFLQLKNLLNLIKRLPSLQDKDYAKILEGITPILVKKTRGALSQKKRVDIKKQLTLLHFENLKLDAKDKKRLSKIVTDYFKKETDN